jgi:hypothetical protein
MITCEVINVVTMKFTAFLVVAPRNLVPPSSGSENLFFNTKIFMEQILSRETDKILAGPPFMEPRGSVGYSQNSATEPNPEPIKCIQFFTLSLVNINIILPSRPSPLGVRFHYHFRKYQVCLYQSTHWCYITYQIKLL